MRFITILIFVFTLMGCSNPKEHQELKVMLGQVLNIEVPVEFEVVDFQSSSAIGDYFEIYRFKFTETNFRRVRQSLNQSSGWEAIQNGQVFQRIATFQGHGFNRSIASVNLADQEVWVQFVWE